MLRVACALAAGDVLLVFDGIKMGATVSVNDVVVASAVDQYVRYVIPLQASGVTLREGSSNVVSVAFDPNLTVMGRFMACTGAQRSAAPLARVVHCRHVTPVRLCLVTAATGGWDWAPYTNDFTPAVPGTATVFSKGIWKSVYTVAVSSAAITYVVPHVYYTGDFPTSPLSDGNHAPFSVVGASQMRLPCLIVVLRRVVGSLVLCTDDVEQCARTSGLPWP